MATKTYINNNIKTLFDLSVELYGNTTHIFKLIADNSFLVNVECSINVGDEIIYDDSLVFFETKQTYKTKDIPVETGIKTYINKNIKSLFDLCTEIYGDTNYVFKLIEDNSFLVGLESIINVGDEIIYDESLVFVKNSQTPKVNPLSENPIKYVTIQKNQSIYDIALQYYGDISYVYRILYDNPQIGNLDNRDLTGISLKYEEQKFALTEFYKVNKKVLATEINNNRNFDDSFDESFD